MTATHPAPGAPSSAGTDTDPDLGLDPQEARVRFEAIGPNELPRSRRERWFARLARHLVEPMALLLLAAAALSAFALDDQIGAVAIAAIVALNAAIAFVQEGTASRALDALRRLEVPTARALRGGAVRLLPAREIVPGDVVLLAAGDRVPADLRLIAADSTEIDESVLTGESLPAPKRAGGIVDREVPIPERDGMAFAGTHVTRGAARGVVAATGPATELGAIAADLRERRLPTPLQRELGGLTARLGAISIAVAAGVFALIVLRVGMSPGSLQSSFLAAVALAVAAVPEGLASVTTVALALGVRRMSAKGTIIRRLPAVETLGAATVLAIDKTGTLTENRMRLEAVALIAEPALPPAALPEPARRRVLEAAALCNDAEIDPPSGDPIDLALLEVLEPGAAAALRAASPRRAALPFDSARRRMTTLHDSPRGMLLLVKGAPEAILPRAREALRPDGTAVPLDERSRSELLSLAARMASEGSRVIALARRDLTAAPPDLAGAERDLTLIALAALRDPIRPEAAPSVERVRGAGIRLLMVTGDHPGTAAAVARRVGLLGEGERVITGEELRRSGIPEDPLAATVYARVDPDQKLALVKALRARKHVVAMTGDGVNDAPALRLADIGVAMGRSGSDVAREAADMVVTDDNLATIVAAVREGRGIYDNLRKVVDYLVAGNLSEILVVVASLVLFPDLGVPLLPIQLLWINLLTDGLPAIALGTDRVHPGLMDHPPRSAGERILGGRRIAVLLARGTVIATAAMGSLAIARFVWAEPWEHARTVMFAVLVAAHLFYAFAARIPGRFSAASALPGGPLALAVLAGVALQILVIQWPAARTIFGTAPLSPREWVLVGAAGLLPAALIAAAAVVHPSFSSSPLPGTKFASSRMPSGSSNSTE
jgi:Ca2+-transporting ATPase